MLPVRGLAIFLLVNVLSVALISSAPSASSIHPEKKGDEATRDEDDDDDDDDDDQKVIVILVDGVRWDYVQREPGLKGFPQIAQDGVRAEYVLPVFPSMSYPNWYSISTGLYPERHGFVHNTMYDAKRREFFTMLPNPNSTNAHWWNKAEPVWINAARAGQRTALYWWAGCHATFAGKHASACLPHTGWNTPNDQVRDRLREAVDKMKEDQLDFVGVYYGQVDHYGHIYGPDSPQTKRALADIDEILFELQENVTKKELDNKVNILIVSDHGMTSTNPNEVKYISLEQFAAYIRYQLNSVSSSMILPEDGKLEDLYKALIDKNIEGLHVYKKEDIPDKYNVKNNSLVLPIWLQADQGYYIKPLKQQKKSMTNDTTIYKGYHGYDPYEYEDMRTIFFAKGPAFKKNYVSEPLENIDYYNLICDLLDIEPKPNNGSTVRYKKLLDDDNDDDDDNNEINFAPDLKARLAPRLLLHFLIYFSFKLLY